MKFNEEYFENLWANNANDTEPFIRFLNMHDCFFDNEEFNNSLPLESIIRNLKGSLKYNHNKFVYTFSYSFKYDVNIIEVLKLYFKIENEKDLLTCDSTYNNIHLMLTYKNIWKEGNI
jgi:hypothetical protein